MHLRLYTRFLITLTIFVISFFLSSASLSYAAGMCPAPTDTGTYVDPRSGRCYSAHGNVGFNVNGLQYSCGPVSCPGQAGTRGNTCVTRASNGLCYAGIGVSGFSDHYCTATSTTPVACPSNLPLYMRVINIHTGQPASGIWLQVNYEDSTPGSLAGKTNFAVTDTSGNAVLWNALVSGDHYIVQPWSGQRHTFTPTQIGSTANLGDQEMNTPWSCGQDSNHPCTFFLNW